MKRYKVHLIDKESGIGSEKVVSAPDETSAINVAATGNEAIWRVELLDDASASRMVDVTTVSAEGSERLVASRSGLRLRNVLVAWGWVGVAILTAGAVIDGYSVKYFFGMACSLGVIACGYIGAALEKSEKDREPDEALRVREREIARRERELDLEARERQLAAREEAMRRGK